MGRRLRLSIRCRRPSDVTPLVIAILLAAAFLGSMAWGQGRAAAAPGVRRAVAPELPRYYLTRGTYGGANARFACASGYHFAALWELLDPSELAYDSSLGYDYAMGSDSGEGPPAIGGWIRTGYSASGDAVAGQANCSNWSTTTGYGTTAILASDWAAAQDMHVWDVYAASCSGVAGVWCVEDKVRSSIHLPAVMRTSG